MKIYFYNTLTRKKELFRPIKKGFVGVYSCGPTVYWNQHLGNMYAYAQWDILLRFLQAVGYKTKWVMNITDVGHMTSDEDMGEDKMEKGAKREGLNVWQIADKYIVQFLGSMDLLNIRKPDVLCRATDHIADQIALIERIEKNGFTYKTKTGLVFDTSKFSNYADFAKLDLKKQLSGARVEVDPEKKRPWDFLLWVTNQPNHIMQWDSPWGKGFPGWHIECTAMSTKYLGDHFDIHTGGKEHIPVHHTNEIAQAFGAFGKGAVNYWLHNEWLTFEKEKISKSLGNNILVTDLIEKGFDPLVFRYLIFNSHYRQGLNFTWKGLKSAQTAYQRLINLLKNWQQKKTKSQQDKKIILNFKEEFFAKLSDDFNTPEALAVVWKLAKANVDEAAKKDLVLELDQILGLKLKEKMAEKESIPGEIDELLRKREVLRKQGKWQEADEIRREIEKRGWGLEDLRKGPRLRRLNSHS